MCVPWCASGGLWLFVIVFTLLGRVLWRCQRYRTTGVGPSLRSSPSGQTVTIFGAYGFVGRYVTQLLGECA